MSFDMKTLVADRDKAFTAFVLHDDWEPVLEYCHTYGVQMPDNPNIMAARIYEAVQLCPGISNGVKTVAMMKCSKLGFSPFIRPVEDA